MNSRQCQNRRRLGTQLFETLSFVSIISSLTAVFSGLRILFCVQFHYEKLIVYVASPTLSSKQNPKTKTRNIKAFSLLRLHPPGISFAKQKHFLAIYFVDRFRWAILKFIGIQCYIVDLFASIRNRPIKMGRTFFFVLRAGSEFLCSQIAYWKSFLWRAVTERILTSFYCSLFCSLASAREAEMTLCSLIEVIQNYLLVTLNLNKIWVYCTDLC